MGVVQLSAVQLTAVFSLLLIPIMVIYSLKLPLLKTLIIATARMSVQLLFIGIYLKYIFALNNIMLNLTWMMVMIIIANMALIKRGSFNYRLFLLPLSISSIASAFSLSVIFVIFIIRPKIFMDSHYLIPVFGMVLGNVMNGNFISCERFYRGIDDNRKEFMTRIMLGATTQEASKAYMLPAINAALSPMLMSMTTMGLVSLPGMMTGQILGGSSPMVAITYQIAIMIMIFVSMSLSSFLNLYLSKFFAFDAFGLLRKDVFVEKHLK